MMKIAIVTSALIVAVLVAERRSDTIGTDIDFGQMQRSPAWQSQSVRRYPVVQFDVLG